jgi:hypothetical protein
VLNRAHAQRGRPFRIAHGTTTVYEAILVELSHAGASGRGSDVDAFFLL